MKITILSNDHLWTYNLRRELIETLIRKGHKVTLVLPYGEKVEYFKDIGCDFFDLPFEKHSKNFFKETVLYRRYIKLLKLIKPDIAVTYTTKPNIYGGMACRKLKIPYITSITGAGNAMQGGIIKKIMEFLYRAAIKKSYKVFFQNKENMEMFRDLRIYEKDGVLVPGSGVNTEHHNYQEYPETERIRFLFIGRINTDKGINEFLQAANRIHSEYSDTEFHIAGMPEEEKFIKIIDKGQNEGWLKYHGVLSDVREIIGKCHCTVLPSYHEGMANVLLESASAGRPLIATDISGCREIITDGETGFLCKVKDSDDLYDKIKKFLKLSYEQRRKMGVKGREKVLKEFDRSIVIRKYTEIIEEQKR